MVPYQSVFLLEYAAEDNIEEPQVKIFTEILFLTYYGVNRHAIGGFDRANNSVLVI